GPTWLVQDLATLDLAAAGVTEPFDVVVSAGNVMTFLAPSTRGTVLRNLAAHLTPEGRLVVGFGAGRGYPFEEFFADAEAAGLRRDVTLATWDLRPWTPDADFLVAVLSRGQRGRGGGPRTRGARRALAARARRASMRAAPAWTDGACG